MRMLVVLFGFLIFKQTLAKCYESLCSSETGYFVEQEGSTMLFSPPFQDGDVALCVSIVRDQDIFCKSSNETPIAIPRQLKGAVVFDHGVFSSDQLSSSDAKRRDLYQKEYFIVESKKPSRDVRVSIMSPPFGTITSGEFYVEFDCGEMISNSSATLNLQVVGLMNQNIKITNRKMFVDARNVEPASWFLHLTPVFTDNHDTPWVETPKGFTSYTYIEFVLPPQEIASNRKYSRHVWPHHQIGTKDAFIGDTRPSKAADSTSTSSKNGKFNNKNPNDVISICVWGSDRLDGQKNIWLQQIKQLAVEGSKYAFTWILSSDKEQTTGNATVSLRLKQLASPHLRVVSNPYENWPIAVADLDQDPGDGTPPLSRVWSRSDSMNKNGLYRYAHERLIKSGFDIDKVTPSWIRLLYQRMRDHMTTKTSCHIMVYGNERGFNSDVLIRDVAKILNIPTVVELLNLFMDKDMVPDYVVAPSRYAAEHVSVLEGLEGPRPPVLVIPPSVDVQRFQGIGGPVKSFHRTCRVSGSPGPKAHNQPRDGASAASTASHIAATGPDVGLGIARDGMDVDGEEEGDCFHVGFMARLAPEKNPGIFLLAAHHVLQRLPRARFTVIGDGLLLEPLQQLAQRLGISDAVAFPGWVEPETETEAVPEPRGGRAGEKGAGAGEKGAGLAAVLRGIDVMVNPSLRGWSETFCIANIEAMAVGVPLITFAVGGVGEYVEDPSLLGTNSTSIDSDTGTPLYTITTNAVVVNVASPAALSEAIVLLATEPELRQGLGDQGRRTVEQRFGVARQIQQYMSLYDTISADPKWKRR